MLLNPAGFIYRTIGAFIAISKHLLLTTDTSADFYERRPTEYVLATFTLLYLISTENPL